VSLMGFLTTYSPFSQPKMKLHLLTGRPDAPQYKSWHPASRSFATSHDINLGSPLCKPPSIEMQLEQSPFETESPRHGSSGEFLLQAFSCYSTNKSAATSLSGRIPLIVVLYYLHPCRHKTPFSLQIPPTRPRETGLKYDTDQEISLQPLFSLPMSLLSSPRGVSECTFIGNVVATRRKPLSFPFCLFQIRFTVTPPVGGPGSIVLWGTHTDI